MCAVDTNARARGRGLDPRLLLVGSAACWGVGTALSKQAVADVPPLTLLAVQLGVSVAVLAVVGLLRGIRIRPGPGEGPISRLGLLNPGLAYALGLLGLTQISASLSVLIWAIEPILILVLAAALLRERLPGWLLGLSAVAIAGLGLVLIDPALSGAAAGVAISATGVLCCAIYTIATRRWISGSDSTFAVVLAQQAYAFVMALVLLLGLAAAGGSIGPSALTAATVTSAVASGLLYYAMAYWLYLSALREMPASIAATSFYLIPVFGLVAASAFGERLASGQWIGAVVVIAAVAGMGVLQRRTADQRNVARIRSAI
jgi:probable blue pigment (indigoidine) exporter